MTTAPTPCSPLSPLLETLEDPAASCDERTDAYLTLTRCGPAGPGGGEGGEWGDGWGVARRRSLGVGRAPKDSSSLPGWVSPAVGVHGGAHAWSD